MTIYITKKLGLVSAYLLIFDDDELLLMLLESVVVISVLKLPVQHS
jgi:hypothetical protein